MSKLSFHARVQTEVNEAVDWYEAQRMGLGDAFFAQLMDALKIIGERPQTCSLWVASRTVRCRKMRRFPYSVLFEIRGEKIRVLCLRHDKRHPRFGMGRD